MSHEARKLTFDEAWNSTTVFFLDEDLEMEIDQEVDALLKLAGDTRISALAAIDEASVAAFIASQPRALEVVLRDIELSEEKFMRIISLLRRIGRLPGDFESEWSIARIKHKVIQEPDFALFIAKLLTDGKRDTELAGLIPQYYLETLNYREIKGSSEAARRIRYKRALIGTYGGRKGYKVEEQIKLRLAAIQKQYGVEFAQGRSRMIETDIDFAVPSLDDPWVVIMCSFQETTSSGQTTKARSMRDAYEKLVHNNSRYGETRAFVNFVDGGGWLARKRDLQRLVQDCHYFINLQHLDMLEAIILKHVPQKYLKTT
ncbi:MAG TPA: DpnII family type II restriction endonuclease [Anaerolineae bacterium]|nr:DpnII family type II restriction endonuclease [Anaerolineae bacterium]HQH37440.1 DpnII family type II restriction endonuclease [Anaerolineae bacterium]